MMKVYLTFDYELFFGLKSGTYNNSIIKPVEDLLIVLDKHNVKGTFFVDAGYLCKLEKYSHHFEEVAVEFQVIKDNIQRLYREGHSIQLHIHPHWEDSTFQNGRWAMDTSRFRLASFSRQEVKNIVNKYKKQLESVIEDEDHVFAYRAGGWCIQPFDKIKDALLENGIVVDSTAYKNGRNSSETHYFNFFGMPEKTKYYFSDNPVQECKDGNFLEVPISSYKLSPLFYWKMVAAKKLGGGMHAAYGDGLAAGGGRLDKLRMLMFSSYSVVSVDGYKASFLSSAFDVYCKKFPCSEFVAIGHPKAFTKYSLSKLNAFLISNREKHTFNAFSPYGFGDE